MARLANRETIYDAAARFRDECLSGTGALTWRGQSPWRADTLASLRQAFVENPDESDKKFFEKFEGQLSNVDPDTVKVAVDLLALYYLYPGGTGASTKLARLRQVAEWHGLEDQLDLTFVEPAFAAKGIGHPGTYYNTGQPWQIAYLIGLSQDLLRHPELMVTAEKFEAATAEAMKKVPDNSTSLIRNVVLHLFMPDDFERIATDAHKRWVLEAFANVDPKVGSVDSRLRAVRKGLAAELGRDDFDFYEPDLKSRWFKAKTTKPGEAEPKIRKQSSRQPRIWIEKCKVAGRPDRLEGDNSLGRALWSPQQSRDKKDIYSAMRDVKSADIILHLTDNEAFTGVSEAEGPADSSFVGVSGTPWAGQPALRVPLRAFRKLDPPLSRNVFFAPPFKEQLLDFLEQADASLFYSSEAALNQGAYLTEAPAGLIGILNAAYRSIAGKDILAGYKSTGSTIVIDSEEVVADDFAAACKAFSLALEACGLTFGSRHESLVRSFFVSLATKRFVILTGLSGSGKTQLAIRFGEWLGEGRSLVVPVRPDWTGAESLFGFEDALQKVVDGRRAWQVPEVLQFMLRASTERTHAHLLVLDEMNLAHVERYFADVLSGMESGKECLPNLVKESDGYWRLRPGAREKIAFPNNLFIVGTVNVDETTYLFSPKVLDRANTFEFRVLTEDLNAQAAKPGLCEPGDEESVAAFVSVASDSDWHKKNPAGDAAAFVGALSNLHRLLAESGHEFGHRTMSEAIRFATLLHSAGDTDVYSALDLQVMQKILPRLHGARRRLEPVLCRLAEYCVDPIAAAATSSVVSVAAFDPLQSPAPAAKLPTAFDKVRRMTALLRANQFASFTE